MAGTPSPRLTFPRSSRLKRPGEFARAKADGRRLVCGCIIANVLGRPPGHGSRLGVVTSKKIGNAVARSRARRLLRECFRLHQRDLARPVDLVLVARPSIAGKKMAEVELDLLKVLRQARLDVSGP
ncbi:MAG TPA: ribonuclease P protein component [Candidatus Cybelea sp.]|jgi:ribonuclease P protein component|nr:ribonuclease P protein component [Candidatus Cybelea sp.]